MIMLLAGCYYSGGGPPRHAKATVRERLSTGYGLQLSTEIYWSKRGKTVSTKTYRNIVCFLQESPNISGNLREFVFGRVPSRNPSLQLPLRRSDPPPRQSLITITSSSSSTTTTTTITNDSCSSSSSGNIKYNNDSNMNHDSKHNDKYSSNSNSNNTPAVAAMAATAAVAADLKKMQARTFGCYREV